MRTLHYTEIAFKRLSPPTRTFSTSSDYPALTTKIYKALAASILTAVESHEPELISNIITVLAKEANAKLPDAVKTAVTASYSADKDSAKKAIEVVRLLVSIGADPSRVLHREVLVSNTTSTVVQVTPLHLAGGHTAIIEALGGHVDKEHAKTIYSSVLSSLISSASSKPSEPQLR